jgi:hypothetical protein
MLSIAGDAKTSMSVMWRTDGSQGDSYALCRPADSAQDGAWRRFAAVTEPFQSDIDRSCLHWAAMEGLAPGTKYVYTVGSAALRSAAFTFATEPEALTRFRFLLISDHQQNQPWGSPSYERPRRAIAQALAQYPDVRFLLTAGDNCDNGQNEIQWNGMFAGLQGVIESLPYMMTTGNHDNRGYVSYLPEPVGKFYLDHADFFDAQFTHAYPQNGPAGFLGENYSFDYGNAHFLILGINAPEQVAPWAYADLRGSEKTWKLGCYHFPIYPVMPEGQNDDAYPWLRSPIEQGRLDVLFAGHEHSLARTYPLLGDELFDRPSQGVVHYIAGNAGANIYCSNARKVWHSAFYPQEEPLCMVHLCEVDCEKLTVTALLEDGRIADVFCLDKQQDSITPAALAPVYHRCKLSFKGQMLEFIARGVAPQQWEGRWFAPVGVLAQAIGGAVEKRPGALRIALYGHTLECAEGSETATLDGGTLALSAPCRRGDQGQLYLAAEDVCAAFGMKYQFAARNNFLNFDHPSENHALSAQP